MSEKQIATYFPNTQLEATGDVQYEDDLVPTPAQLAEMSRALGLLADTQGPPGVMATVPDELTSNLQTYITLKAQEKGRLAASGSQTLEAKFDERDILGWAGSLFTWWKKLRPFDWQTPSAPQTVLKHAPARPARRLGYGLVQAHLSAQKASPRTRTPIRSSCTLATLTTRAPITKFPIAS